MMLRIALTDFILQAELGPLRAGLDQEYVLSLLGEPDERCIEQWEMWFYGCLQISFVSRLVSSLGIHVERGFPVISSRLKLELRAFDWINASPEDFLALFGKLNAKIDEASNGYRCLTVNERVAVCFSGDERLMLAGIFTWPDSEAQQL